MHLLIIVSGGGAAHYGLRSIDTKCPFRANDSAEADSIAGELNRASHRRVYIAWMQIRLTGDFES